MLSGRTLNEVKRTDHFNGLFYAGPFIHPTRYFFAPREFGETRSTGGLDLCSAAVPLVPGREGFFAVKPRAHPVKLVYRVNSWFHGTIFIHHSLSSFSSAFVRSFFFYLCFCFPISGSEKYFMLLIYLAYLHRTPMLWGGPSRSGGTSQPPVRVAA